MGDYIPVTHLLKVITVKHIDELIKLKYIPNILIDKRVETLHNKLIYHNLHATQYANFGRFIEDVVIRHFIFNNRTKYIIKHKNIIYDEKNELLLYNPIYKENSEIDCWSRCNLNNITTKDSQYYFEIPINITNIYDLINKMTSNDYGSIIEKYFNEYDNIIVNKTFYKNNIMGPIDILNDDILIDLKVCKTITKQYFIQIIVYYIINNGKQKELGIYDYYNGKILWIKTENINKEKTLEYILNIYNKKL